MAVPFSRSVRATEADSIYPTLVGMSIAILVFLVWMGWFVLARITLYETSTTITVPEETLIVADFPASAQGRVRRGQHALFYPAGIRGTEHGAIPLIVFEVTSDPVLERVQAQLYPATGTLPFAPTSGVNGYVEVEVEHISPAMMVMRNVGQFVETPQVRTTPQQRTIPGGSGP